MKLILLFVSVFLPYGPMLFLLWLVWWLDRYEREPIWLVSLVFIWGAVGGIFFGILGSLIVSVPFQLVFPAAMAQAAGPIVVAPLVEETTKGLILVLIVFNRNFDNMTDGFVYGAATGLGFGMTENLMYFIIGAAMADPFQWMEMVIIRTLFTAPMHAFASSCFGAALGFCKFRKSILAWLFLPLAGLGCGMTMHGVWNSFAVVSETIQHDLPLIISILLVITEFALLFGVFQLSLLLESRMIRRELGREVARGLIPAEHVRHIASYFGRFGRSWLPRGVDKGRYIRAATTLAFRRAERNMAPAGGKQFYQGEIERLRAEVSKTLGTALPQGAQIGGPQQQMIHMVPPGSPPVRS